MAQCPACNNPIDEDFGLVSCQSCGAAVFIDLDGTAKVESNQAPNPNLGDPDQMVEENEFSSTNEQDEMSLDSWQENFEHAQSFNKAESPSTNSMGSGSAQYSMGDNDLGSALMDEVLEPEHQPASDLGMDMEADGSMAPGSSDGVYTQEPGEQIHETQVDENMMAPDFMSDQDPNLGDSQLTEAGGSEGQSLAQEENFADIVEFANSEESQARDGLLQFHVTIAGIDSTEVRQQIKEALDDQRFMWDIEGIMNSVQGGELKLELSAAKAFVIISRIKSLPVTIRWEQHAIIEP